MALPWKFSDSPFHFRNRILKYVPVNQYYLITYTGSLGWYGLVGKATPCTLESTGFQLHWNKRVIRPNPPLPSPSLLHSGYRDSFLGGRTAGAWLWSPTPILVSRLILLELWAITISQLRAFTACCTVNCTFSLRMCQCNLIIQLQSLLYKFRLL